MDWKYLSKLNPETRAATVSRMDLDGIKKLRNSLQNTLEASLRPYSEALHCPTNSQDRSNGANDKSAEKSKKYRKEGNDLYAKRKHNEIDHKLILHLYTKSIAHAPPNSQELALAYGNRSALWLHLYKYDHCLTDINRALQITVCNDLKQKLISRQEKCKSMQQGQGTRKKLVLPAFKPSKLVPCAAESIALNCNEKYGRHYIAARNIRPGEIILSEESPYISVKNDQIYSVCSHCLAFAWASIPCNYCVYTVYCNEVCKEKAWQLYHDAMCPKLSTLQSFFDKIKDLFDIIDLSTRIMDISIKREGLETVLREAEKIDKERGSMKDFVMQAEDFNCKNFRLLYSLASNRKEVNKTKSTSLLTIRGELIHIKGSNCFKFGTVPQVLANGSGNPCECEDFESCLRKNCAVRGSFLGPCSSLMNHSCIPNVTILFLPGPRIVMLTQRPIKKGEQLFVSYYGPYFVGTSKNERYDKLRKNYLFDCECLACRWNWPENRPDETDIATSRLIVQSELLKTFGSHADMLFGPLKDWYYSQDLFEASVKMCEFIHGHFGEWEAMSLSVPYTDYFRRCISYLYGEDENDFLLVC